MYIGEKIRKLRELKGISQEAMAANLGISQASYSRLENEDKNISIDKLMEIAKILEVDVWDIVSFDEKMVFNNTNQTKGNAANIIVQAYIEKGEIYEKLINELKEEISFLREMLKKCK